MPFKSRSQARFMFAAEARGELPKGTARTWAHHTPSIKALPNKVRKKKRKKKAEHERLLSAVRQLNAGKKDVIPGGLADGKPDSAFPRSAIRKGVKVELEHTDDPRIAREIARDHLTERPDYYDMLAKAEHAGKRAALLPSTQLQPHQVQIAEGAEDPNDRKLLYHSLGSGKSLSAISAAERAGQPYLGIVPAAVRPQFKREQTRFTDQQTPSQVMSYQELLTRKPEVDPQTLVVDESQRLRNPDAATAKRVAELAAKAKRLYLLSGTPLVNRPGDLAPLVSMLTNQKIEPKEFEDQFVGEGKKRSPGIVGRLLGAGPRGEQELINRDKLKDMLRGHVSYFQAKGNDIKVDEETHEVPMGEDQQVLYKGFWKNIPLATRWKLRHKFPLSNNELQRFSAFLAGPRQVGLSVRPFLAGRSNEEAYNLSPKLQAAAQKFQELRAKNPDARSVVFSNFVEAGLKPYGAALDRAGIPNAVFHGGLSDAQRKQLMERYNKGELGALLLGPSGAEGLSLRGTRLIQLLDPHWNEARLMQAIGRGIRFDSHQHLPPEDRQVTVQRFKSVLPSRWYQRGKNQPAADQYLQDMSDRKQRLNSQFLDVLREVGSEPIAPRGG